MSYDEKKYLEDRKKNLEKVYRFIHKRFNNYSNNFDFNGNFSYKLLV